MNRNEQQQKDSKAFFSSFKFIILFVKNQHLKVATTLSAVSVSGAILCPAVSVSDVMNKAGGINGKSTNYTTSQSFSVLHWERVNQHGCASNTNLKQ